VVALLPLCELVLMKSRGHCASDTDPLGQMVLRT
jgi:hypothetical protein